MSIIYTQTRIGRYGKPFKIYKFRTMCIGADTKGGLSTAGDDPRLTRIGKLLRKYQIDELPQLWNIIKRDINFVGPRPEIPSEIDSLDEETKKIILSVRPGLTSPAVLHFLPESKYLKGSDDPHKTYCDIIKPEKMRMNVEYVKSKSFWGDIKIIIQTICKILLKK